MFVQPGAITRESHKTSLLKFDRNHIEPVCFKTPEDNYLYCYISYYLVPPTLLSFFSLGNPESIAEDPNPMPHYCFQLPTNWAFVSSLHHLNRWESWPTSIFDCFGTNHHHPTIATECQNACHQCLPSNHQNLTKKSKHIVFFSSLWSLRDTRQK